ncbi:MAG TPA: acyloxyacyl hydrolase [Pyrinomonadaceae bacterium]|nr:acyloxyacyl hydrolase [Pyrinomonadaceae bacterium]
MSQNSTGRTAQYLKSSPRILAALLVTFICASLASAQSDSGYELKRGDNEYGVWGGGAFSATTAFGGLTDAEADERGFVIAAFRYGRTLAANEHLALQYTLDAIPMALAVGNIESATTVTTPAGPVTTFTRSTAYGAGVTPLGLQLDFANGSRVKPFVHVNGGLLLFNESVPLPDAGKLALVGEAGAGLRVFTSERRAVSFGVRFHHISNGDRAGSNRGLNQFVIYAGFSVFK